MLLAAVCAAAEAPVPVPAGQGYLVHVASMKTEAGALREWSRLQAIHPDLLAKLSPTLVTANVGEKGVFLRLYAGMLPDESSAKEICAALEATRDYCAIVKP